MTTVVTGSGGPMGNAEVRVDLDAYRANIARLRQVAAGSAMMAVVKADAYGHGAVPCARAARQAGAEWLGTATADEALELRAAGIDGRVLTWISTPGAPWERLLAAGVDVSANAPWAVEEIAAAAAATGVPARLHLKADTGLGRAGAQPHDWPELVEIALKAQADGLAAVVGLWSHFACADEPSHPSVARQLAAFRDAVEHAERAGVRPEVRHLANSPATLLVPESHYDLIRPGIATYGLSPAPAEGGADDFGLRPVMTFAARLALVKQVPAGHGVSYGHTYTTSGRTTLALVPVGYGDGVPRAASNLAEVYVAGRRRTVAGRVAMDQFVVDLGESPDRVNPGDEVVIFGPGDRGEPTAQDWADATGTISYEIITRIGARVPRRYVGSR